MPTPADQARRQRYQLRLSVATLVCFLAAAVYQFAVVNPNNADIQRALGAGATQSIENNVAACQLGNRKLRRKINQNIVRPIVDVLAVTPNPSPEFQEAASGFATVPYARCHRIYPLDGSEPEPPYYRQAKLPPPIPHAAVPRRQSQERGTSPAPAAPSSAGSTLLPPLVVPGPSATSPSGGPVAPDAQPPTPGPQGPTGPSGPPGPRPQPPPPGAGDPSILDVPTDLVDELFERVPPLVPTP